MCSYFRYAFFTLKHPCHQVVWSLFSVWHLHPLRHVLVFIKVFEYHRLLFLAENSMVFIKCCSIVPQLRITFCSLATLFVTEFLTFKCVHLWLKLNRVWNLIYWVLSATVDISSELLFIFCGRSVCVWVCECHFVADSRNYINKLWRYDNCLLITLGGKNAH